jgi:hypothetical protein
MKTSTHPNKQRFLTVRPTKRKLELHQSTLENFFGTSKKKISCIDTIDITRVEEEENDSVDTFLENFNPPCL